MTWWNRPHLKEHDAILCDGAVRSGKTVCMVVGFFLWSMASFNGNVFALCGKTIASLRRNVVLHLQDWLGGVLEVTEYRSENRLEVRSGNGRKNTYFLFGGQDEGSYIVPSQANRVNVFNSLLRARVTESGVAYLTSVYRGKKIAHTAVKVSSGDSFAECNKAFMSYNYRNLGVNNERLDFIYGEDGGLVDFISATSGSLTVELTGGDGIYKYTLRGEDAKAIAAVAELSKVLKSISGFREMAGEAERHIEFVKKTRERFAADSLATE